MAGNGRLQYGNIRWYHRNTVDNLTQFVWTMCQTILKRRGGEEQREKGKKGKRGEGNSRSMSLHWQVSYVRIEMTHLPDATLGDIIAWPAASDKKHNRKTWIITLDIINEIKFDKFLCFCRYRCPQPACNSLRKLCCKLVIVLCIIQLTLLKCSDSMPVISYRRIME